MSNNNKGLRFALSGVLAFILGIVFTLITIVADLYIGGININVMAGIITDTTYCSDLMNDLVENCEAITLPIGFPTTVLDDIFAIDTLNKDVGAGMRYSLRGEKYEADTEEIEQKLRANIDKYLEENNLEINEEQKDNLDEYVKLICDEYTDMVEVPVIMSISPYWNMVLEYALISAVFMVILATIIIILLLKLQGWVHRGLRFVAYSSLTAFLMNVILPTLLYRSGFVERLSISPKYFYEAMVYMIEGFLKTSIALGFIWLVVFGMLLVQMYNCKSKGLKFHIKRNRRRY